MVARRSSGSAALSVANDAFRTWRGMLSRGWLRLVTAARRLRGRPLTRDEFRSLGGRPVRFLGAGCFVAGQVIAVAVAPSGQARAAAVFNAAFSLIWLALGAVLLGWLLDSEPDRRKAYVGAWFLGLVPWVIATNTELRTIAWVVSAAVTLRALHAAGLERDRALRAVGIAWAVQVAAAMVVWLGANVLMAVTGV